MREIVSRCPSGEPGGTVNDGEGVAEGGFHQHDGRAIIWGVGAVRMPQPSRAVKPSDQCWHQPSLKHGAPVFLPRLAGSTGEHLVTH